MPVTAAPLPREVLVFSLDGALYAVAAALVRETLWLPELAAAEGAAPGVAGVFNLRGQVLPVVDLALCLGRGPHRRRPRDQVVVLALAGGSLGMLVGEVRDFAVLAPDAVLPQAHSAGEEARPLAAATCQWGDELLTLVDAARLPAAAAGAPAGELSPQDPADRELFRQRAQALRQPAATPGLAQGRALAVVVLGDHYFGLGLGAVREFCRLPELTPIPCCPLHIAGVFSLRGQLVTVLEVAAALGLPPPPGPRTQAVIGSLGDAPVGIGVDAVVDIFLFDQQDLQPLPPALARDHGPEMAGVTTFAGRRLAVLDLPFLLNLDRWVVDQTIP